MLPMSASMVSLRPPQNKKKNGKKAGVPLRSYNAHVIPTGMKKGAERIKSNVAVNQSTSLNHTTDTMTDLDSERGSLKYVSANLDNPHLQKEHKFS